MKRLCAVLLIASCGTPQKPAPSSTPGSGSGSRTPDPGGSPVKRSGARTHRIEAPHGGAINLLATSADGKTVATVDELGGVRLWPALDGSAEPRVVDLPRPVDLVVGSHAKGYVLGMTDTVGALTVQLVDRDGLTLQRAALPIEPAYGGVASAGERGVLAWRVDQRIVLVSPESGSILADLPTEGGQRIVALTANADKAIAVIEAGTPTTRRARWVTLHPQLAWGGFIDGFEDFGPSISISPSGKRVAGLVPTRSRGAIAVVLDTAAGKLVATEAVAGVTAIALPDDDHLALAFQSGVGWRDLTKVTPRPIPPDKPTTPPNPIPAIQEVPVIGVATGGRAIGAVNGELVVATPATTEFLGYGLESPAVAAAAPDGQLLIGFGDTFALLDAKLIASAPPDLQIPTGSAVADLAWLSGNTWLVQASRLDDGITGITLVDAATKQATVVRTGMAMVHMMAHDRSTGLVAFSLGDKPALLRHAPGTRKLEPVATLATPKGFERAELVPVNPALANGTQVVVVHMRDRLAIRWAKDAAKPEAGPPLTVDGSLASVDAAGRVYVWTSDAQGMLVLAIYRDGKQVGVMPTDSPTALWPDPRGERILQVSQRSIELIGADGTKHWAQPLQGVTEAIWLADSTIAIISAAGIARIAAATGDVQATRCGWRFGLSPKPHPISPRVEPICTQLH